MKALTLIALALALEGGFLLTLAAGGAAVPAKAVQARPAPVAVAAGPDGLASQVRDAR